MEIGEQGILFGEDGEEEFLHLGKKSMLEMVGSEEIWTAGITAMSSLPGIEVHGEDGGGGVDDGCKGGNQGY
jgi:hypothetical protein